MKNKRIVVAADHAGFELKQELFTWLKKNGVDVSDLGTNSAESADYPDFAHPLADAVEKSTYDLGILVCGSANGVAITANKHQGIRAAVCWMEEIATLSRQHNNANVLCLPARFVSEEKAKAITEAFLNAEFEGGRHQRRVSKISC